VAFIDATGTPVVVETDGKRTLPSIFAVDKQGNRIVGQPAQRQMVVNPRSTFHGVKRLIGRRYNDEETTVCKKSVSYNIVPSSNGDAWVQDEFGKSYAPSEIASFILTRLKESAEAHTGEKITRAVITVPAYFDNHQRKATEDAGRIAGLTVERIINEPTAAALAYGINRDEDKSIVVYDLGGGTFDVSVLQLGGGVFEVKSTSGDTFLGGEDFNHLIVNHVINEFKKSSGIDLSTDKVALQRVREAAEAAKHDLSTRESVHINLPYISVVKGQPATLDIVITKEKYEKLAEPLIQRSLEPIKEALKAADMTVDDISYVIMVGGMTRMPKVREAVKKFFKREPSLAVNPDEAVAIGAAIQGSIMSNSGLMIGEDAKELILVDVTPLNLGIKVHSGEMAVIVPAQTAVPCRLSHVFTTVTDFQTEIHTEVYQGNRPMAEQNRLIGKYTMTGIPPAPAGVPKVEVTFDISASGLINVTSIDKASKVKTSVSISMGGGLSEAEIEKMRKDAEKHAAEDEVAKAKAKVKEGVLREIQAIQRGLESVKTLDAAKKEEITNMIAKVTKILDDPKSNGETVEAARKELKDLAGSSFTAAYQNSATEEQPKSV